MSALQQSGQISTGGPALRRPGMTVGQEALLAVGMSPQCRSSAVRHGVAGRGRGPGRGGLARALLLAWLLPLAALLASCSTIRLGYENLPMLVGWEVDSYLDLDADQKAIVRRHVLETQRWHRQQQLPGYARFLDEIEQSLEQDVPPARIGEWRERVLAAWAPLAERLAPAFAELAVTLRPEQLVRLQAEFDKRNRKAAKEYASDDPRERRKARLERLEKRAEFFFGHVTPVQLALIRESAAGNGQDDYWWQARLARQKAIVGLLQRLATERPAPQAAVAIARAALVPLMQPIDATDRQRTAAAAEASDALSAAMLQQASPAQRRHMLEKLRGYNEDIVVLASRAS